MDEDFQREHEQLLRDFSRGTPMPPVATPQGSYRPSMRLGWTEGDFLVIGGTIGGTLDAAEQEGKLPLGTAEEFKREAMPPPLGEAPMVQYRDMLRNLLTVAARYVEIEDAYPEPRPERSRD
jgi:hypothetical protein